MKKKFKHNTIPAKLLCIMLAISMLPCFVTNVEAAETEADFVGDVDGDGSITPKDVTKLRRYLAGGWDVKVVTEDGDVDEDGAITPKDVTKLRRYLAGGWGISLPALFESSVKVGEITFPLRTSWTAYMEPASQGNGVYLAAYITADKKIYMYESLAVPEKDFKKTVSSKENFEHIGQLFVDELVKQSGATDPKVEVFDEDGVTYGKTISSGSVNGNDVSFAIYFKLQDNNIIVTMAMEMSNSISDTSDVIAFKTCKSAKKE